MLNFTILLLLAAMMAGVFAIHSQRTRKQKFREFATTADRTLQLESCGGIRPTSLYEYLLALASTFRTQAMLRSLKLRPGEFEQVVTNAIESAYLLKGDPSNKDAARGSLVLFASCLDPIMCKTLAGEGSEGDEGNYVGTAGAVVMLASIGWYAGSNADLVTCALTEATLAEGVAEYWRTGSQAHRDQVERSFERAVRTALDPSTAAYVRQRVFAGLQDAVRKNSGKQDQ